VYLLLIASNAPVPNIEGLFKIASANELSFSVDSLYLLITLTVHIPLFQNAHGR
jgi:hypothetical protein